MSEPLKPNVAKKLVREYLEAQGLVHSRLVAHTVSFEDFGYGSRMFVTVHGWAPAPRAVDLQQIGHANGFIVDFSSGA